MNTIDANRGYSAREGMRTSDTINEEVEVEKEERENDKFPKDLVKFRQGWKTNFYLLHMYVHTHIYICGTHQSAHYITLILYVRTYV